MTDPERIPEPILISQDVCAKVLGVSPRTIARMVADGQLPAVKLRKRTLIPMESVRALARVN